MKRPTAIVYIDGFNFYYGAVKNTSYKWLDFELLCRNLLPGFEVTKIRYFTAREKTLSNDPGKSNRQRIYLRALDTLPPIEIHFGKFSKYNTSMPLVNPPREGTKSAYVKKIVEKRSDVSLATNLLVDAFDNLAESAILFSNDSDFAEPIEVVRNKFDKITGVVNPIKEAQRTKELVGDHYFDITDELLASSQLPDTLRDKNGEFHKPDSWYQSIE